MNITDSLDQIENFLNRELENFKLNTKKGEAKAPQIFQGYLPPKINTKERNNNAEDDYYPFVIMRFLSETASIFDNTVAHFRLAVGTYSEDEGTGWKDALSLLQYIKRRLIEVQDIGSATVVGEIETMLFEEQKRPFYHGLIDFSLQLPKIYSLHSTEGSPLDDYNFEN